MAKGRKRKATEDLPDVESVQEAVRAKEETSQPSTSGSVGLHVHPDRIRELRGGEVKPGPVIYW